MGSHLITGYSLDDIFRAVGIVGFAIYVCSFFCLTTGRLDSTGPLYFALVLSAATCVAISMLADFNLSAMLIQTFYILMALIGIARRMRAWVFSAAQT